MINRIIWKKQIDLNCHHTALCSLSYKNRDFGRALPTVLWNNNNNNNNTNNLLKSIIAEDSVKQAVSAAQHIFCFFHSWINVFSRDARFFLKLCSSKELISYFILLRKLPFKMNNHLYFTHHVGGECGSCRRVCTVR